jgi:predicted transcriptional regulator of viral defense system
MSVRDWIHEREIRGKTIFSLDDVRDAFPDVAPQVLFNALSRLKKDKLLYSPCNSFYVILPPQYVIRGAVPPYYFMDSLMKGLGRQYYFGLLSAASLWGAAHQRAQVDFVVTAPPRFPSGKAAKSGVKWLYKHDIPKEFLCEKSGEAGPIVYSNAELTALDLVSFEQHAGGLSAVASVLVELLESTDFNGAAGGVFQHCDMAAIQRLGYLVENILHDHRQGATIFREWRQCARFDHTIALSPRAKVIGERDARWKVIVNAEVEVDEI